MSTSRLYDAVYEYLTLFRCLPCPTAAKGRMVTVILISVRLITFFIMTKASYLMSRTLLSPSYSSNGDIIYSNRCSCNETLLGNMFEDSTLLAKISAKFHSYLQTLIR